MLKQTLVVLTDQPEEFQQWLEDIINRAVTKATAGNITLSQTRENLFTKEEACRQFGVSKTTLTQWMKAGVVPFIRLGRRVYLERDQVMAAGRSHTKYKRTK